MLERETLLAQAQRTETEALRLTALESMRPATTFSHISKDILIWIVCVIVLLYAVVGGGLEGCLPHGYGPGHVHHPLERDADPPLVGPRSIRSMAAAGVLGAMSTIHDKLPQAYFQIFGAPQTPDFTWYYVLTLSFMAAITVVVQPNGAVMAGSAKDEMSNRSGCGDRQLPQTLLHRVLGRVRPGRHRALPGQGHPLRPGVGDMPPWICWDP